MAKIVDAKTFIDCLIEGIEFTINDEMDIQTLQAVAKAADVIIRAEELELKISERFGRAPELILFK